MTLSFLPEIFSAITSVLSSYGYAGIFISSFIAALALPIPASLLLAASGALAADGYMNIYEVLLVALVGNVAADLLGYWIARRYGETMLRRLGFGRVLRSHTLHAVEKYLRDFPQAIIYVTRLVTEAGPAVNILAGLAKVRVSTFIFYDILGEASYVLLFALTGYFLGDAWQNNTNFFVKGALVLISLGTIVFLVQIITRRHLRR